MDERNDVVRRRLQIVNAHVHAFPAGQSQHIQLQPTVGEYITEEGYSVVLPEKLSTGKWNVYRSALFPLKLVDDYPDRPEIKTLHDNFVYAEKAYSNLKYLGTRVREDGTVGEYRWMTYAEAGAERSAIGSGLVLHGIPKGASIGLYLINRAEWMVAEHACSSYSYVSVPLYDTLGPDAVKYIINHAEIVAIFCTPDKLQTLLTCLPELPSVRLIVVVGGLENSSFALPGNSGVETVSYSILKTQGQSDVRPFIPPLPEDVATICYTSGTTGTPKGALLTHRNLIASTGGSSTFTDLTSSDVHISYLPLAHIYERANVILMTHFGTGIGFYQGDILKLMDDMEALKPTIFVSVPRLYNRIYDRILSTVRASGGLRERLFNVAYNAKKKALDRGKTPSPVWDRLVFNKIKARLGGRVRVIVSGASPISPEVIDFLKICFGGNVSEGYGMTETACVITSCREGDPLSGHVGAPNPACDMNYTSDDKPYPRGEICVRGPLVFKGYYKDEVQTREILDEDGWLHTGDIGLWLPGGRLKIIDRKKNIFKLAQGEYIAPEKIENVYQRSKFVSQCFIHGDSFNYALVAIVSVDPETLSAWAKSKGIKHADNLESLCKDPVVKAAVLADMDAVGTEAKLRGFEFAKAITLVHEPFSLESGLLTPTMKIKRPQAKAYFAKAIEDMYAQIAAQGESNALKGL
ncbi:hypothetical protein O6H91_22G028900 [Diphasiastrum complanatum]|uniref:Uncharacterized protein n=1 Tax=Diphasiastrum complanatum TaxID=34168 RepID=A0ACC2AEA1_DIPCM|nr:hypothetical protein O6H91_22G028900 [Diphasiastrum complanatum]